MIINVETPSFCPDDCKYYVQEKQMEFITTITGTELFAQLKNARMKKFAFTQNNNGIGVEVTK